MVKGATRLLALVGCVLFGLIGAPAEAKTDGQQRVVERARLALDSFLDDPQFEYMRVYVQNAYAVLIVPEVLKAGFFLGGEYGVGVLLVRDAQSGGWGQPAFYSLYGGSFGVQFGGSMSDRVFTIMNEGAVDKLIAHKVQFGGDMGHRARPDRRRRRRRHHDPVRRGRLRVLQEQGAVRRGGARWHRGRAQARLERGVLRAPGRSGEDRARAVERTRHRGRGPARSADPVLSGGCSP